MSRRGLRPEEARLWALVAATVRPRGDVILETAELEAAPPPAPTNPARPPPPSLAAPPRPPPRRADPAALKALLHAGVGARPAPSRPAAVPARLEPARPEPAPIEPNRRRRIVIAREPIGARLDLHGHDQDQARAALHAFLASAHARGVRAVLVITGKGSRGEGVLRQRVPEWLSEPPSRARVAGFSTAERRHGGEGALYVALKRG